MTTAPPPSAEPINLKKQEIEKLAAELAKLLNFAPGDPLPPVVQMLGGKLIYQDMDEWFGSETGSIVVRGPRDFDIFVSSFSGPLRDRFTIAHELGHYFLHSRMGKRPIRVSRHGSNKTEWEANSFAAGFLMPELEFRQAAAENSSPDYLASRFLVSPAAAEIRKKSLGIN